MIILILILTTVFSFAIYQYIDYRTMISFYGRANSNDVEEFIRNNWKDAKLNSYDPDIIIFPSLVADIDKIIFIKRESVSFMFPYRVYGYGIVSRFDETYKLIQTLYASLDADGEIKRKKMYEKS